MKIQGTLKLLEKVSGKVIIVVRESITIQQSEKSMFSRHIWIIIFSIISTIAASCHSVPSGKSHIIDISGQWKVLYDDDVKISRIDYDDSKAAAIRIPGDWNDVLIKRKEMSQILWLRKSVYISDIYSQPNIVLELGNIGIADELYFNGIFIGGNGIIPSGNDNLDYTLAWKTPRKYIIPRPLIKFNHNNTIALRIFSHVFSGITGNKLRIVALNNGHNNEINLDFFHIIIHYFAISLSLFFLIICIAQYCFNRKKIMYLYLALFSISGLIFNLCFINLFIPINGIYRLKILLAAYTSISFFLALFLQEILEIKYRYSTSMLTGLFLSIMTGISFSPTTHELINYIGFTSVIYVLICQMYISIIFILSVIRDLRRYWLVLFGFPVLFSAFRNAYFLLLQQYSKVYLTIFIHVPVVIIIINLVAFYDYEFQKRTGETLFQSLLRKSQKLKLDLQKAKKIDAKREPQDIIHELIDYLDKNFTETYNRTELAQRFGLNVNYMIQLFKKTTGKTITDFINEKRIDESKKLIIENDIKLIDAAYHVGFENYNYYHRIFKQLTGLSPRVYRDMNKNNYLEKNTNG